MQGPPYEFQSMNANFQYNPFLSATSLLEALQVESIKELKELKELNGGDTFEITKNF